MERNDPRSDHFYKNPLNGMKLISECLLLSILYYARLAAALNHY